MQLVSAIFKDNKYLIENKSNYVAFKINDAIARYGRQQRFIKIFLYICKINDNFVLESQIITFKYLFPSTKKDDG